MTGGSRKKTILFTAFEPSGDAHAAGVVRELASRHPEIEFVALGGPHIASTGIQILSETARDGAMGLGGLKRVRSLLAERRRLRRWLEDRDLLLHVGVDSPSANIRVAPMVRGMGARTVQFVAPQFWAWAPWRLKRFRELVDRVLCILPFEEAWFGERNMWARYVGHPVVNRPLDQAAIKASRERADVPEGSSNILILPGSRRSEIIANMPLLARAFESLGRRHEGLQAVILAAREDLVPLIRERAGGRLPDGMQVRTGELEGVIDWADLALNTSGTVSLDLARQGCPMVAVYKMGPISCFGSKFILKGPHQLLPNIIAGRGIVPEFVPHAGGHVPIVDAADRILSSPGRMEQMRSDLAEVIASFGQHDPDREAADAIDELID